MTNSAWRLQAACQGRDQVLFFPDGEGRSEEAILPAARVCAGCPVRAECLEDAVRVGDRYGIRAGMTGPERRRLRYPQCLRCALPSSHRICRCCQIRAAQPVPVAATA